MSRWPYNTSRWKSLRLRKLQAEPLCQFCTMRDVVEAATVVDHHHSIATAVPAFPPLDGLNSLCEPCHNFKTASHDTGDHRGRVAKGCDTYGNPLADDGWNASRGHTGALGALARIGAENKEPRQRGTLGHWGA